MQCSSTDTHCLIGMTSARQMSGTCQIATDEGFLHNVLLQGSFGLFHSGLPRKHSSEHCVLYLSSLLARPDRSQPSFTALSQRQHAPRHHKILERVRIFESDTHQISSPSLSKGGFCPYLRVSCPGVDTITLTYQHMSK
jgi:hypothetical protein